MNVVFPIRRVVNATKANADFAAAYEPILEAYEPQLPRALCRLLRPSPASGGTVPEPKEALSYLMGQLQQRREDEPALVGVHTVSVALESSSTQPASKLRYEASWTRCMLEATVRLS